MGPARTNGRSKTRILVVDDHPLIRECLKRICRDQPGLVVCAEAEGRVDGLRAAKKHHPDLAIIDLTLKESHGLDLIQDLQTCRPKLPILVLSTHDERLHAERVVRAGARGFINKQADIPQILEAIRTVIAGKIYLSEEAAAGLAAKLAGRPRGGARFAVDALTDRELRVFELLGQGCSTRRVAERLRLHLRTVETYRARIKQKLQLEDGIALLQHAIRWSEMGGGLRSLGKPA